MQVEDLNGFTDWVKKNVLNSFDQNDNIHISAPTENDITEPDFDNSNAMKSRSNVAENNDHQGATELLEFIIGINNMA